MVQNGRPILLVILILVHISAPNRIRNRKQFESRDLSMDRIKTPCPSPPPFDRFNDFDMCVKRGKKITNDICIANNYDKFSVPLDTKNISAPLIVQAKIIVFGLKDVNLVANTYSLYKTLYEEWTDPKIIG